MRAGHIAKRLQTDVGSLESVPKCLAVASFFANLCMIQLLYHCRPAPQSPQRSVQIEIIILHLTPTLPPLPINLVQSCRQSLRRLHAPRRNYLHRLSCQIPWKSMGFTLSILDQQLPSSDHSTQLEHWLHIPKHNKLKANPDSPRHHSREHPPQSLSKSPQRRERSTTMQLSRPRRLLERNQKEENQWRRQRGPSRIPKQRP